MLTRLDEAGRRGAPRTAPRPDSPSRLAIERLVLRADPPLHLRRLRPHLNSV
jgi:hypothetical protein